MYRMCACVGVEGPCVLEQPRKRTLAAELRMHPSACLFTLCRTRLHDGIADGAASRGALEQGRHRAGA